MESRFEDKARAILIHHPADRVEGLICRVSQLENLVYGDIESDYSVEQSLTKEKRKRLEDAKEAFKLLLAMRLDGELFHLDIEQIKDEISLIQYRLDADYILKTGGKRTQLNTFDLTRLLLLRSVFYSVFPKQSLEYEPGTLLHQLSEALINKSIPKSAIELLTKFLTVLEFRSTTP